MTLQNEVQGAVEALLAGAAVDVTSDPLCIVVAAQDWRSAAQVVREHGFTTLEFVTAADFGTRLRITALMATSDRDFIALAADIPALAASQADAGMLGGVAVESLADIFPAATWHERETAEMFGIDFVGHPDLRPLLLQGFDLAAAPTPLRRHVPLVERVDTPWPGAKSADPLAAKPRRTPPSPGVRSDWVNR